MPSRDRRRETDSRADRLESEIRSTERGLIEPLTARGKLFVCSRCGHAYEERSVHCPRCDRKTMGYLTRIPSQFQEEATRNAIRRARRQI